MIAFLLRAKRATYAGRGAEAASSRPGSHDLRYEEGAFSYIDSYLGGAKFAGEEAVWQDGVPLWAMNYAGQVIANGFSGDFLKEALCLGTEARPYRGPVHYVNGDYVYTCAAQGNFHWFNGLEEIYFKGGKVYECVFHGGDVTGADEA